MQGSVSKDEQRGTWTVVYDLGEQPRDGCTSCDWARWTNASDPVESCPQCGATADVTYRRRQRRKRGFARKSDADSWLRDQLIAVEDGTHVDASKLTLREYLQRQWLPAIQPQVAETTYRGYESDIRNHVVPTLGGIRLQALEPAHFVALYGKLAKDGGRFGTGLANKSIRNIHGVVHRALADAVRWRKIARNVLADVDPPRHEPPELTVWTLEQLQTFLAHVQDVDDRLAAAWILFANTGMRRGEALGLRWSDVELDEARLRIRQQLTKVNAKMLFKAPKSKRSRRQLALDAFTVSALRTHRKRQLEAQLAAGDRWCGGDHGLVFTDEYGYPIDPSRFSKMLAPLAEAAGLPAIRVHDLRHTYATVMLTSGRSPKLISERLGHASITQTYDRYAHWIPGHDEDVAAAGAALIFGESA